MCRCAGVSCFLCTCLARDVYFYPAVNVTCHAIVAVMTVRSCWENVGRAKGQVAGVPSAFNFVSFADAWTTCVVLLTAHVTCHKVIGGLLFLSCT